jgi:hypothetical protein
VTHKKRLDFLLVVVLIAATLAIVTALVSTKSAAARETEGVSFDIEPTAKLVNDGQAVKVRVQVTCPQDLELQDVFIYVTQDAEVVYGTSRFFVGGCSGKPHTYKTTVTAQRGQFHTGSAYSSGYVVALDPATGTIQSASDTEPTLEVR